MIGDFDESEALSRILAGAEAKTLEDIPRVMQALLKFLKPEVKNYWFKIVP
jgi:hypothetical protein